jgi:hypothetical protein
MSLIQETGGVLTYGTVNSLNTVLGGATGSPTGTGAVVLSASPIITGNSINSAALDPQTIQYVTVSPTVAAFNAMYTTGIPLVAAQGAGTYIECLSILINLGYGSAAFSGGAAVGGYIGTNASGTLVTGTFASTIFTTFSANKIATAYSAALGSTADASNILNTGLVLSCPTQVFTGGTGATINIKVAYRVHNTLV